MSLASDPPSVGDSVALATPAGIWTLSWSSHLARRSMHFAISILTGSGNKDLVTPLRRRETKHEYRNSTNDVPVKPDAFCFPLLFTLCTSYVLCTCPGGIEWRYLYLPCICLSVISLPSLPYFVLTYAKYIHLWKTTIWTSSASRTLAAPCGYLITLTPIVSLTLPLQIFFVDDVETNSGLSPFSLQALDEEYDLSLLAIVQ
ncbi:hypothetical protein EDB85DRAFT_2063014 [Lactarius pseudohatsudake]|nr:hypothetical protein EDB85DRAFT_2063014 [Lactarius pseudohatsudake]